MKKYRITLTENQLRLISHALDMCARIDNCQFEMVIPSSAEYWKRKIDQKKLAEGLDTISQAFGLKDRHESLGLHNCDISARDAYAMHIDFRHQLWKDGNDKNRVCVCSDNLKVFDYKEPDVVIEKVEK